jgi:hypothetical protein
MARVLKRKDGEDVCGCSIVMIDLVIISAELGEDVEQRTTSSTGRLVVVAQLGAALIIQPTGLTPWLSPSL